MVVGWRTTPHLDGLARAYQPPKSFNREVEPPSRELIEGGSHLLGTLAALAAVRLSRTNGNVRANAGGVLAIARDQAETDRDVPALTRTDRSSAGFDSRRLHYLETAFRVSWEAVLVQTRTCVRDPSEVGNVITF